MDPHCEPGEPRSHKKPSPHGVSLQRFFPELRSVPRSLRARRIWLNGSLGTPAFSVIHPPAEQGAIALPRFAERSPARLRAGRYPRRSPMRITKLETGLAAAALLGSSAPWRPTRHRGVTWRALHVEEGTPDAD